MAVSVGAKPARAKATPVSRERFMMPAGYGGAWPGFETTRRATHQRPGATGVEGAGGSGGPGRGAGGWRQGQGGPRDRPLRAVRLACGDLAGGRARQAPGTPAEHASNTLNRKLRLHRRCEGRKRAWPRCPWAAAGPGRGAGRAAAGPGRASRSTTPSRQARVWRSRGRAAAHRHTQPGPGPTSSTRPLRGIGTARHSKRGRHQPTPCA